MPRRKGKPDTVLQNEIKTRVNDKRYEKLTDILNKSRYHSMSELVRDILENKPIKVLVHDDSLEQYMEVLVFIQKELRSIGININQITRHFNSSPTESQKMFHAMKVGEQFQQVGLRVDQLLSIVKEIAKKWLQK
ncbi:plasmid mobilization relaxosome protein MobC [Chryseosolibacter indicus]|uniref:Plasmid mobilization relaxosome protein MobC n=1 Tax=Chryseosolibacter indicus TaxID=2782351 RepID=A0ABS5VWS2_9BACT|nr:plasmid mobilization relaxosome protein MobC [Chryseosolibacter indicus]MBT1705865.1 plasmid mobilization relaxosome protein MobC [Chryseosolibacter indicus]